MAVRRDSDLLQVLVIHLGQDVDADLLAVEDLPEFLQTQTEMQKTNKVNWEMSFGTMCNFFTFTK